MRQNLALEALQNNLPDYEATREIFFELYPVVIKLGGPNYVAMSFFLVLQPSGNDLLAIYLCGVAAARVKDLSERGIDAWSVFKAWELVQDELTAIFAHAARPGGNGNTRAPAPRLIDNNTIHFTAGRADRLY